MRTTIALSLAVAVLGSAASPGASGATIQKFANRSPAGACMLSIPTTNTAVRPKASGFRNEGGVSNFVICNFDIDTDNASFTSLVMYFASIDGAAHTFDCTGMDRYASVATGDYSTKSVSIPAGSTASLTFSPSDFPDTSLGGWNASVTCTLPPGASIITTGGYHDDQIGS